MTSPTPSTTSTTSNASKLKFSGKTLLPYSVTPPRPRGPTEAEKKIEEMTRQIEEEMEKHEEEGEYFGKSNIDFLIPTLQRIKNWPTVHEVVYYI